MTVREEAIRPGDVMVVYDPSVAGELIRIGEWLEHKPHAWDHILVFSHWDSNGTPWAMEAHPGKIGWTAANDLRRYMSSPHTIDNIKQPKTDQQRATVVQVAHALFGTPYDVVGIAADTINAFGPNIWQPRNGEVPTALVCSSYVAYDYYRADLERPEFIEGTTLRTVEPADWAALILTRGFDSHGAHL